MITRKIWAILTVLTVAILVSCKVESDNIFTMFEDVNITFHNDSEYAVTDYKKVNDGDSVHISFTMTSANKDMIKLVVDSTNGVGGKGTRDIVLNDSQRRSYSGRIRFKMRRDGKVTFRIYAIDNMGVYIGDGYKSVTVEGAPSYTILADRKLYKINPEKPELPTFYSIRQGKAFTYTEGQVNSADIDFGLYDIPDTRPAHLGRYAYNLYSINTATNPYPPFDISNWERRQTLFSAPITAAGGTSGPFNTVLVSSSRIEEEAKKRTINLTQTSISEWENALGPGNMVYFLTPEGKYGAMLINQNTVDAADNNYISITTKIQN